MVMTLPSPAFGGSTSWRASPDLHLITKGISTVRTSAHAASADFAPTFKIANLALSDHPSLNAYMLNMVGKGSFGHEGAFQPYASGGIGWLSMRTSTFTLDGSTIVNVGDTTVVALNTVNNTQSKFATNIGGGFFAYAARWGIRGDIRYYHASAFDTEKLTNNINDFTQALVSGLTFWRANLGVAYRW